MNAIFQVIIGEEYANNPVIKSCTASARRYAERLNADYILWDKVTGYPHLSAEKLNAHNEEFDHYDYILVLDADVMVTDHTPNVFEDVQSDIVGMGSDGTSTGAGNPIGSKKPSGATLMYSKAIRPRIREFLKTTSVRNDHRGDEFFIADAARHMQIKILCRTQEWDCYPITDGVDKSAYFIHFVSSCWDTHWNPEDWQ